MLHLGSIGGTSIDVDFTFFILIFLFAARSYESDHNIAAALIWAPVIFISILVHEFAHAASIAMFGFGSSHIVLGGMGGVTINERRSRPWQELLISAAGPLSSFALAWICLLIFYRVQYAQRDPALLAFLPLMYGVGILWGEFNLLPIPPLDGGHVLRNLLRMFLREKLAFIIAVWVAMIAGGGLVIFALARRDFFFALIIGWFTFNNFQQWEEYRQRGYPGD